MKNKKLEIRVTAYEMRQLEQEAVRRGMTSLRVSQELNRSFSRSCVIGQLRTSVDPRIPLTLPFG